MPYEMSCSDSGCHVLKKGTGRRMNKRPMSKAAAQRYMRALYANVPDVATKEHTSGMIALMIPRAIAEGLTELSKGIFGDLADISRVPVEEMHITLLYLGKVVDISNEALAKIHQTVGSFGIEWYDKFDGEPLIADVHGVGRFCSVGEDQGESALVYLVNGPLLGSLRERLRQSLESEGIVDASEYGFLPHITIGYLPESTMVGVPSFPTVSLEFTDLTVCLGDQRMNHKFASSASSIVEKTSGQNQSARNVEAAAQVLVEQYGWQLDEAVQAATRIIEAALNRQDLVDPDPQTFEIKMLGFQAIASLLSRGLGIEEGKILELLNSPEGKDAHDKDMSSVEEKSQSFATKTSEDSSVLVFKGSDGRYRWVTISSNGFEDRDGECVSTKALEDDCVLADQLAQTIGKEAYGPLTFWHQEDPIFERQGDWTSVKAGDSTWGVGWCDFNTVIEGMLVESGTFFDDSVGERLAVKSKDLRVSIAFAKPPGSPDRERVYHQIRRYARTLVPLGYAIPSNRFTSVRIEGVT